MKVPECHRSALLNKMSDPAGAMIFTSSGCGPVPDPDAAVSMGGLVTRCEPGMTRSGPLSWVNAEMHHMADSVCHGLCAPALGEVGVQASMAAARQGCPKQQQVRQLPVRPEHRGRGVGRQRMLARWGEVPILSVKVNAHHAGLRDLLVRVGLPGGDGLADHFF